MTYLSQDQWAQWLLHRRFGGDTKHQQEMMGMLYKVRDRVLGNASLREGDVLLDLGTGDGLIAFGALDHVGEQGKVIFSDVSQDLLDHCHDLVQQMGVANRCDFIRASADDLSAIPDASINVVTTRSVLIYVKGKQQTFDEVYRAIKPGGRISIFEPINRFGGMDPPNQLCGCDVTPIIDIAAKIRRVYQDIQPPDDPMLNFDERDLIELAVKAGFKEVHLQLEADVAPLEGADWEAVIRRAANPLVPTLEETMSQALTPEEATQFTAHMRPLVERGEGTRRSAVAYLWAIK